MHRVDVYFDVVSPWSYIGVEVISRFRKAWNLDLRLKPIFLGGIMQATGNQPPAMLPQKGQYMGQHDLPRSAAFYGLKIEFPSNFPAMTVSAMRVLHAAMDEAKDDAEEQYQLVLKLSLLLWRGYWGGGGCDIGSKEGIAAALLADGTVDGDFVQHLLERTSEPAIKQSLKSLTEEAVALGAFGAPWFVLHEPKTGPAPAVFFGSDRFHLIAHELGVPWPSHGDLPSKL
mmetsp:Transcript_25830/g.47226  ORF Transcript_25830/g.47226 Transcript_25830/m.47226 type:complete len:229 (+) Transcript_25830:2-688(+)